MRFTGVRISRILSILVAYTFSALAAPGDVDLSFNAETGVSGWVYATTPLADGKLLISGDFTIVQGTPRSGIARLNANGLLDPSFDPPQLTNVAIFSHIIQPDGKIVTGAYDRDPGPSVWRLNPDGTIDPSFTSSFRGQITKLVLQPDGRIVVGGFFAAYNGAPGDALIRLNSNGSVDSSFKVTSFVGKGSTIAALRLQSDGKILVSADYRAIRLNTDGSEDTSFNVSTSPNDTWVTSIAVQPDDKILIGGHLHFLAGPERYNLVRVNADGSTDTNFFRLGRDYLGVPALELDNDGAIFLSGYNYKTNEILRINNRGVVNTNFVSPKAPTTKILSIAIDESENIIAAGAFTWPHGIANIARLRSSGSLDLSFQPGFTLTAVFIPDVIVDSDGRALGALADIDIVNRYTRTMAVQRFNLDGSLDTNFAMTPLRGYPRVLTLQKDGKVLAASMYEIDAYPWYLPELKRLNNDGTIDASFKVPWITKPIRAAVEQPDRKILLGGDFTSVNGVAADRVVRLNADGTIDHTFQSFAFLGSPAVDAFLVQALAVQPDGKIVVGFGLHSCGCDLTKVQAVIRLNADGSYDASFDSSEIVPNQVESLMALSDGKILVGGFQFVREGIIARHGIIRLNADGSLDQTFGNPLAIGADVRVIAIEESGKVVLVNNYTIARLTLDGSLDPTFKSPQTYRNGFVNTLTGMALAHDGNVYYCDGFDGVNGARRPRLARLFGTPVPIPLKMSPAGNSGGSTLDWSNSAMHLQSAPSVNGPFTDVLNAKSPWKPSPDQGNIFFRLRGD